MNKEAIVDAVRDSASLTKYAAALAVDATLDAIRAAVANGEEVRIYGFGSFEKRHHEAKSGRDPRTGAAIPIAAKNHVKFHPSKTFTDALNR